MNTTGTYIISRLIVYTVLPGWYKQNWVLTLWKDNFKKSCVNEMLPSVVFLCGCQIQSDDPGLIVDPEVLVQTSTCIKLWTTWPNIIAQSHKAASSHKLKLLHNNTKVVHPYVHVQCKSIQNSCLDEMSSSITRLYAQPCQLGSVWPSRATVTKHRVLNCTAWAGWSICHDLRAWIAHFTGLTQYREHHYPQTTTTGSDHVHVRSKCLPCPGHEFNSFNTLPEPERIKFWIYINI